MVEPRGVRFARENTRKRYHELKCLERRHLYVIVELLTILEATNKSRFDSYALEYPLTPVPHSSLTLHAKSAAFITATQARAVYLYGSRRVKPSSLEYRKIYSETHKTVKKNDTVTVAFALPSVYTRRGYLVTTGNLSAYS